MSIRYSRRLVLPTLLLAVSISFGFGIPATSETITGTRFEQYTQWQNLPLQEYLRVILADEEGAVALGPLDPLIATKPHSFGYHEVRVLCADLEAARNAVELIKAGDSLPVHRVFWYQDKVSEPPPNGLRAALVTFENGPSIVVTTINQMRFLVWARETLMESRLQVDPEALREYARAVSDYLFALDKGFDEASAPIATEYNLPEEVDFYARPPDYVIEGYQNYKDFLGVHAPIHTDYATGILSFVPGDSLLQAIKAGAPEALFPNKEAPMFQEEYRKFLERGGDVRTLKTLTREGFDTLQAGEYFFAVGANGTVRFGRELLRDEVERIEQETGRKVPRANHAFLFPGEAILTAGAFFIARDTVPRIVEVNAQSGHYFYSNVSATIRDDIAVRSDYYLGTLGHFFIALDSLGIPYDGVLISKM
ncbi:MAG: hypothetical protein RBT76_05735 [candidate division Zixibacteria bacterium]|nr:hypothetical protein [candidate division Zixibacteria bacterium]